MYRPLHHRSLDHLRHGMRRITAADRGKTLGRGSLFGDYSASTEPGEAAAQRSKRPNGPGESPPPGLRSESVAVGKSRLRNCGDQCLIVELGWHQGMAHAS
jgi:hypothetical protein